MSLSAAVLCLVVGVSDGDTVTVRCDQGPQERIRLVEIDAPEKRQPYGQKAKQVLSDLIYKKEITVSRQGKDRYKRTLAQLSLGELDINREMVRQGYAWCYRQYLKDKTCLKDEAIAKQANRGLWQDKDPQPPWQFRHHSQ